jgi:NAD(P)-dependent dehydrogenase (short-subunit alcohol dehydrogenase family)
MQRARNREGTAPREMEGSVVVVTGASSGIGRATARLFAEHGARVVLAARSEQSLREVASECEAVGGQALVVPTDVTDEEAVRELARRSVDVFGRIDVWVNNAGVMVYGSFEEVPTDVYRRVIETNLFGEIHGSRAALSRFREQGGGVLVNMCSVWGRLTSPYVSAYVTSKFAIRAFSECLRQELAGEGDIHVVTILPQSVDTPVFRQAGNYYGRAARAVPPVSSAEEVADRILRCARDPRREVTEGRRARSSRCSTRSRPACTAARYPTSSSGPCLLPSPSRWDRATFSSPSPDRTASPTDGGRRTPRSGRPAWRAAWSSWARRVWHTHC